MYNTYKVAVTCDNCGHSGTVEISCGRPVNQRACPNCQCSSLKRCGDNKVNPVPEVPPFEYLTRPQPVPYVRRPGPYEVWPYGYKVWCHPPVEDYAHESSIYAPGTK